MRERNEIARGFDGSLCEATKLEVEGARVFGDRDRADMNYYIMCVNTLSGYRASATARLGARSLILGAVAPLLLCGLVYLPLAAAQSGTESGATLQDSGIELRNGAQAFRYFDVTGRRSGVFGRQNGQFEAWIYPIKLLHGFRVEFQQKGLLEPVRGEVLLRQVITRPESTTLVYVHPNFTVREIIWTPTEEPAVVVQFEADSAQPLDITAAFVPDLKPMWPASFGGQHSYWLAEEKAFVLTDGTEHATAVIGSPAITEYSEHVDHQLGAGEMLLRLHFEPKEPHSLSQPLVMALSLENEANARRAFESVLGGAGRLFEDRVAAYRRFVERTLTLETPDPELNRDFLWAKVALESGWVCSTDFGCGLIAGYGPSGAGERPGFAWWFGGDALMATWALEDYGDLDGALQALRFLKARQRSDGKMMHELSQSAGLIDWFGKYGYAYYHADTTPMYLYSIDQYWRRTGDRKFLEEFWPSAKKAYEYCVSTLTPDDGLMDNTKAGLAAVEVGVLRGKVVKDLYLEGFWLGGAEAMTDLASAMGETQLAEEARVRAAKAGESLQRNWWNPAQHTFAFGLTADGHQAELSGAWPAVALALGSQIDAAQARQAVETLAGPKLTTDWGVRWLANDSPLYDPLSYNNGTAWPFISGIATWAEYRHELPVAGFQLWKSLANLTGLSSPGMLPELMNGDRFLAGEFAVPHQLFSSVGVVLPAVRGVLGIETNFSASPEAAQLDLRPNLPADWPFLRFQNYAIGGGSLSGEIRQEAGQTTIHLRSGAKVPLAVRLAPAIPALARISGVKLDGKAQRYSTAETGGFLRVEGPKAILRPSDELTLSVKYEGGIAVVPPPVEPQPGERSSALRVLSVQADAKNRGCQLRVRVAGLGGREYALGVISGLTQLKAENLPMQKTAYGYEIRVAFAGAGYATREICLSE